jgi:hypothetical protein
MNNSKIFHTDFQWPAASECELGALCELGAFAFLLALLAANLKSRAKL